MGPIPVNWYWLNCALAILVGAYLVLRWAPKFDLPREEVEGLLHWIIAGAIIGARLYFLIQDNFTAYLREPWRMLAVWEGGLAFFGGLFGSILAAYLYTRREELNFPRMADLFAPAVPAG